MNKLQYIKKLRKKRKEKKTFTMQHPILTPQEVSHNHADEDDVHDDEQE